MAERTLGERVKDILDIIAMVFKLELRELLDDLKNGMHFGVVIAGT